MKEPLNTEKLHIALRQALEDLREVAQEPAYVIDMGSWHRPIEYQGKYVCEVCMAGAVMAKRLCSPDGYNMTPGHFPLYTERMLEALNALRCWGVDDAYDLLLTGTDARPDMWEENIELHYGASWQKVKDIYDQMPTHMATDYHSSPPRFFATMEQLQTLLEQADL